MAICKHHLQPPCRQGSLTEDGKGILEALYLQGPGSSSGHRVSRGVRGMLGWRETSLLSQGWLALGT